MEKYLTAGYYTDADHPAILEFVDRFTANETNLKNKVIALYYAIRDGFRYNPYEVVLKSDQLKASFLLKKTSGYCVEKSNLYAACLRVLGVPSRLGYGKVRNHLGTHKIEEKLRSDILVFHGYTELYLNNKWIKATPVFNEELCEKLGVEALDFDGEQDAVFQKSDKHGNPFMEYLHDYGTFDDLPFDLFVSEMKAHYPHLFVNKITQGPFIFDFEN